jgi:SNF2 family DNA or RNA helicase
MKHQKEGVKRLARAEYFAMGAEQGTGKTWMLLADAEARFLSGEIDALLVIAPNGVHVNWIIREVPAHLSVPRTATFWLSGAPKRHTRLLEKQLEAMADSDKLHIHAMNVDAINTKSGLEHAKTFLREAKRGAIMVVDESQCIKNPTAKRTQRVIETGRAARLRRIASGTLVANSPIDLFSQFDFLSEGLLGTRSFRAFVAEYAELLPAYSPLVQDIIRRTGARGAPQIIAKDKDGRPKYRNLEKLSGLMSPYTFRVTKAECLDLPEKIYQTQYFEMEPDQRAAYQHIINEHNWFREDGTIDTFSALTVINKLRQVTSGFIIVDGEPTELRNAKPRLEALDEIIGETTGQFIIWASFREEIKRIAAMLEERGETFVEYHGGTSAHDRTTAIDDFQSGRARIFVGNPAAAGTGLTLTAAETAIYYSSDFSLVKRSQSEDRCHRIGTRHPVLYIDIVGRETIDERIAAALQAKKGVAEAILANL